MIIYVTLLHLLMSIFLGGSILLGIAYHFETGFTIPLKEFKPKLQRFSYTWILLLIPFIFFGAHLYQWSHFTGHKAFYFSPPFLILRQFLYLFLTWIGYRVLERRPWISLIVFFIFGSFFSVDWGLALEGHWFSNMYSFIYIANAVVACMALVIFFKFENQLERDKVDLAHLFLVVTLFWLYFQFSQFIIYWMGNLPREVIWYTDRLVGWKQVATVAIPLFKVLPIFGLCFLQKWKTNPRLLKIAACSSFGAFIVELGWIYL